MKIFIFYYLECCFLFVVTSQSNPSGTRKTYLDLEEQFLMSWSYNSSHIIFELKVNTTGWIAIGFSQDGDMVDADIHLGWVDNGKAHITDRHGLDHNGYPPLDDEQNVELLEGWECDGVTFLKFVRQLAACDEKQDRPITADTMRMIYAYDDDDQNQEGNFNKHTFQHRGTKFVFVLEPQPNLEFKETDVLTFEARANDSAIPNQPTYYKCTLIEIPKLKGKHHMISTERIIEEKYRSVVHHVTAYACIGLENSTINGNGEPCFPHPHPDFESCREVIFSWASGIEVIPLPENAGYPFGGPDGYKFFKLSVHYNNPDLKVQNIKDSSGLRIYYTPTLRKYDAGKMKIGLMSSALHLFIPPRTESYKVDSTCDSGCFKHTMQESHTSFIKIYAAGVHAHTLGRKLSLRHIRNGKELPSLAKDDNFHFKFHHIFAVSPEVVFKKGDSLQVVCDYSSINRPNVTSGGFDTTKEMCLGYINYYPKLSMTECYSSPMSILEPLQQMMGIKSLKQNSGEKSMQDIALSDFIVSLPPEMANQTLDDVVTNYPWDKESSDSLSKAIHRSEMTESCIKPQSKRSSFRRPTVYPYPSTDKPEIKVCKAPSTGFATEVQTDICGIN